MDLQFSSNISFLIIPRTGEVALVHHCFFSVDDIPLVSKGWGVKGHVTIYL